MYEAAKPVGPSADSQNDFDVVIVGAGLSGIAAAVELQRNSPWAKFVILEQMESYGGTWLSNQYPGARSDSDMFTYSFSFAPWEDVPIARGDLITGYFRDVIEKHQLNSHIRYNHKILQADWRDDAGCWAISAQIDGHGTKIFTSNFLMMCQGYYRHRDGYLPRWRNMDVFAGEVLHPQRWPKDCDYAGKRIVVVGSGATAATLLPVLAEKAAHVTQLQRSPSYYIPMPNEYPLATQLRELDIPKAWAHEIVRQQICKESDAAVQYCLTYPDAAKRKLLEGVRRALGVDAIPGDFVPRYNPWVQRVCVIPDSDFFDAIKTGKASVATGEIEAFTRNGIKLTSGEEIAADIVVTATGFNLSAFGDVEIFKNGRSTDMTQTITYRGLMFSDTPNFSWTMGYVRGLSFTLRSELVAGLISKLLNYMHERGYASVTPRLTDDVLDMERRPFFGDDGFEPGYITRSQHILPRSLTSDPWRHSQDYWADRAILKSIDFEKEPLHFERGAAPALSKTG